jgi:hypothetical protein
MQLLGPRGRGGDDHSIEDEVENTRSCVISILSLVVVISLLSPPSSSPFIYIYFTALTTQAQQMTTRTADVTRATDLPENPSKRVVYCRWAIFHGLSM